MKKLFLIASLFLSQFTFAQLPSNVPSTGLVGYWPFTGNANDQSINLNNGTVNGATLIADRFGNPSAAYNFNGTSDHINVPNNSTLSGFNDMTISVWVNMSQFSGIQAIVSKWFYNLNCGNNSDNYAFSLSSNMLVSATNNNNLGGYTSPQTFTSGDLNVWKHFVMVSNSALGHQAIYINGVLTGTGAVSGTICNTTNPLIFGAAIPTFRWFKGKLDDIGIWNRVLTNCEIQQLYTASAISLTATSSNSLLCVGNSASLTVSGANTYSWNTSSTNPIIVVSPTVTTTYTVIGTNTLTGCSNTITVLQNVSLCTGKQTNNLNSEISVYPNPTNGLVIIKGIKENDEVEVMNVLSVLVFKIKVADNKTEIDLREQKAGVYFVKLKTENGTVIKKIVKE